MMMSTILMLFGRYLMFAISKLRSGDNIPLENKPLCEFEALFLQFTRISSLFWLNAMAHAVWSSFKSIQAVARSRIRKLGIFDKKFKWYALYAWGSPLVVSIVTIAIQNTTISPRDPEYDEVVKTLTYYPPGISYEQCRIHNGLAQIFYIHIIDGPVLASFIFDNLI